MADGDCSFKDSMASVKVGKAVNITAEDEVELRDAVFNKGPVSVCYQVVNDFRDYRTGVY